MGDQKTLPKKVLVVRDCTFILPEDFDGTVEDAFAEFLNYRASSLPNATHVNDSNLFSTFEILLHSEGTSRVCGQYAIYELIDGRYQLANGNSHT